MTVDEKLEAQVEREFWFPEQGSVLRGFKQIQGLLEQAREQPGLAYLERWCKIDEAQRIVGLIENSYTREIYNHKIKEARIDVDRKYSRTK